MHGERLVNVCDSVNAVTMAQMGGMTGHDSVCQTCWKEKWKKRLTVVEQLWTLLYCRAAGGRRSNNLLVIVY